ncbi:MAG TPA: hypothetical protein VF478_08480 [Anaerolineae bacterium]
MTQLAQLESAQLVRRTSDPDRSYIFKHALTQDTAYESLLHAQRRDLHRRVAQAYQAEYGDRCLDEYAEILAGHYALAGDAEQVLVYATHAGDGAARIYANTEAIAFYTQALTLGTSHASSQQLQHLYLARGRAHELAGDYAVALENYRAMQALAQARGDRVLELESLMAQATAYAIGAGERDTTYAETLSTQALALAGELGDRKAQARIYWNLLLANRFGNQGPHKAVEYGEKSLALARELGLKEQIALSLKDLSVAYAITGRMNLARENTPEIIALWRELNNTPMLAEALGGATQPLYAQGRLAEAVRSGEESIALNQAIGNRYGLSITGCFLWYAYREQGHLKQAIEMAEESIAIAEAMKIRGPQWGALVELAATFDWLGDYARATECAQRALAGIGSTMITPPMFPSAVMASIALHQGDRGAAEEWLAPYPIVSFDDFMQANPFAGTQFAFVLAIIELALARDDPGRALALVENALGSIRVDAIEVLLPSILHFQARAYSMLNRADEAYALLIDARDRAEALQSRYRLLPILFALLKMESERGDAAQVEHVRKQARELIEYISDHTPEDLRRSFLSLPDVQKAMTG